MSILNTPAFRNIFEIIVFLFKMTKFFMFEITEYKLFNIKMKELLILKLQKNL